MAVCQSKKIKEIITSRPVMLLFKGKVFDDILKKERITMEEIYAAARKKGVGNLNDVEVIVLETTGILTIIPKLSGKKNETIADVDAFIR